jgi:hypothetical protein
MIIKDARELLGINLKCKTRPNKAIMLLRKSVKGFLRLYRNYNSSYIIFILS